MDKIKALFKGDNVAALLLNVSLIVVMGLLMVWGFFYVYLPAETHHGETITVPNVTGMTYEEAAKVLAKQGLRYEVYDSAAVNYRSDIPAHTVLSHTPASNAKVKDNRKIYFRINPSTPPAVNLPDLYESSLKNAYVRLRNLGIGIGKIKREPDPRCATCVNTIRGISYQGVEVTREMIAQGFKIEKGDVVDLVVSDGLGNTTTEVPNLLGMPLDEVEFVLVGQGLGVGRIRYQKLDTIPGIILRQSPAPIVGSEEEGNKRAARIRLGRVVNLWVSESNTVE